MAQVVRHIASRQRGCAFGFGFHVVHTTGRRFNIVVFFHFAGFQQDRRDHEGDGHGRTDGRDVSEIRSFWRHRQHRQDRPRRSWRHQTAAQHAQGEHAGHTAKDNGQDQAWVHQHVREVNFVDTAQEVNDCRTASRLLSAAATKEHVRQQYAHTRTRVGFNQEEDRLAEIVRLLNTQRREDTVVDGVVQEQDFRRFNEDRRQRQHVVRHHKVNACRQNFGQHFNRRANAEERQNREDHPDDARREVVHQHFEAGFDLTINPDVEFLNRPAAQRTGNHCTEEHRHIRTDDNTHGRDGTHYATTVTAHQTTTGETDEQRQEIGNHWANKFRQRFVRQPPCRNEQCSDDTPRDKRADIWHHHVAEETTKALNFDLEIG